MFINNIKIEGVFQMAFMRAGRKNILNNKQLEWIFKEYYKPILREGRFYHNNVLNRISSFPTVYITYKDEYFTVHITNPNDDKGTYLNAFNSGFFKSQARGMVIAQANGKHWTDERIFDEFKKGMKKEALKYIETLNKGG